MKKTGYLQDTLDPRDRLVVNELPFGTTNPPTEWRALAQGFDLSLEQQAESCVGFSIAEALYAHWRSQGIASPKLASPLFIWWNARQTHNSENQNSGTYIRMALKQMKKLGFCPDSVWKGTDGYDLEEFARKPSRLAYRAAYDQKMTELEYYRVTSLWDSRIQHWKQALSTGHPIVFGLPITESFLNYDGQGYIQSPSVNAAFIGGHAMCALGYDEDGIHGPQTWGSSWGRNGWFKIGWQYVTEWAIDQWALRSPQYFSEEVEK